MHDFPIQGPRTTHWLLLEIARGDLGLVTRHHWWKQGMRLSSSDAGVGEHLFLCGMLKHGTQSDQLNLPDLVMGEAISRRLQLWEERNAEKLRASTAVGLDQREALWWPKNWKHGSPLSWPKRQSSSRKEEKDVRTVNWWRQPQIQGAGTIESPSGSADFEWLLRHDQRHRPQICFLYRQALARRKCT